MAKDKYIKYINDTYNVNPDYPFDDPNIIVFRHSDNKKWFGIIMTIQKRKLGINEDGHMNIVNLKCAQELLDSLWTEKGIFPAYHMSKKHWLSISLDGDVADNTLMWLTNISYDLTSHKPTKRQDHNPL